MIQPPGAASQADRPHSFPEGVFPHVTRCIESLPSLQGKVALDMPCGAGRKTATLRAKGAEVIAPHLFPDGFMPDGQARFATPSSRILFNRNLFLIGRKLA